MKGTVEELCVFSPSTLNKPNLLNGGVVASLLPEEVMVGRNGDNSVEEEEIGSDGGWCRVWLVVG